jgi:hypothetical protein
VSRVISTAVTGAGGQLKPEAVDAAGAALIAGGLAEPDAIACC